MTKISVLTVCGAMALASVACQKASGEMKADERTQREPAVDPAPNSDVPRSVDADNTKRNRSDRDSTALGPMNQSNDPTDLKISQEIRKSIVSDAALSGDAKNVKVITSARVVTLRGPVKTVGEKQSIEDKARATALVDRVDNQLEVETK